MIFVENRRTGFALGEDTKDRRTAGEDERFSCIAGGLDHYRHGVTILREALRSPLDLPNTGKADNGIYFGYGRGQACGIGEVADDWFHPCGSQLRKGVISLRHSHDLMPLLQQLSGDGGPDESSCASDKDLHVPPLPQGQRIGNINALRGRASHAWPPSPRHKVPDSDAGHPRSRRHSHPDSHATVKERPANRTSRGSAADPNIRAEVEKHAD